MSAKLFFREFQYQELDLARFLSEAHGFDNLYRTQGDPQAIRSKFFFIKETLLDFFFLIGRHRRMRGYSHILALWHSAPAFIALRWLGLLRYDRLLWFGFAVRSPKWSFIYRFFARLDRRHTWFAVFTKQEAESYAQRFGIEPSRMLFIAHGDWPQPIDVPDVFSPDPDIDLKTPFYFAGGFTNRNYTPVIETFKKLEQRLIIVCSKSNCEVVESDLPANITVYRDITFPEFELLLRAAKAVIIPLNQDTGAAGHSVLIRSMRNAKLILANNFRILDDYIEDGANGILLNDMADDLKRVILEIEAAPERFAPIQEAAFLKFQSDYSQEALERRMSGLIKERWIEANGRSKT